MEWGNVLVPIAANNTVMSPTVQKSDTVELKSDMKDLKTTMQQIAQSMAALTTSNNEIREQLTNALAKVNETLSNLTVQVNNLEEREKEKTQKISEMDNRIQRLEQQYISRNIEIKNVTDTQLEAAEVVKTISASVGIKLCDVDIGSTYRVRKNNKIIVEFSSLTKKRELMSKLRGHRINANILNVDDTTKQTNALTSTTK